MSQNHPKSEIKPKLTAADPAADAVTALHPDDHAYALKLAENPRLDASMFVVREYFESLLTQLGNVAEFRAKLDPDIDGRAYLRRLMQVALEADARLQARRVAEAAEKRADAARDRSTATKHKPLSNWTLDDEIPE